MTDEVDRWLANMAGSDHAALADLEDRIALRLTDAPTRPRRAPLAALAGLSVMIGVGTTALPIGQEPAQAAMSIDMSSGLAPSTLLDGR